jgi:hypothetical protein
VLKHLHLCEAANGPVPENHCLNSIDVDRSNTDPANWLLIPRALLPRLNGGRHKNKPIYDQVAPELRPAVLAVAKIEHQARQLRKAHGA